MAAKAALPSVSIGRSGKGRQSWTRKLPPCQPRSSQPRPRSLKQTTLGTYGHLCPNTNLEVAKKLTGILQVQSATESIANYTSNQHTAIYHRTVEEK